MPPRYAVELLEFLTLDHALDCEMKQLEPDKFSPEVTHQFF